MERIFEVRSKFLQGEGTEVRFDKKYRARIAFLCILAIGTVLFTVSGIALAQDADAQAGAQVDAQVDAKSAVAAKGGDDGTTVDLGAAKIRFGGYLREHISLNLQNSPETKRNDTLGLQMARTTAQMDADTNINDVRIHAVGRVNAEYKTDYLRDLESLGAASDKSGGLMSYYNTSELRELFAEFAVGSRTMVRLGKQQIVWGETDFFQAMDVVHGFDYTWRSFLEAENELYRKPLILGSATVQVPEAGGVLQVYFRPGYDQNKDIGNTYDFFGGRWAAQSNRGTDFFGRPGGPGTTPLLAYNYHHPEGDVDKPTGGARWAGVAGPVNYSLAYLRTMGPDPVVSPSLNPFGTSSTLGILGEFFYPKYDIFGVTANGYVPLIDAVLSTEIVYTKDQLFGFGKPSQNIFNLGGWNGLTKKNVVRGMVRIDKTVNTTGLTARPSDLSIQLFDTWVTSFNKNDNIVDNQGFGGPKKEHSALVTLILFTHYMNDRINPTIAGGYDLSYGGGFFIPSVDFNFGDKWRFKVEADLFFPNGARSPGDTGEDRTHVFGFFSHNNQLSMRLTRQF